MRLLRTNLNLDQVEPLREQLAQSLFDHIPVGVGAKVNVYSIFSSPVVLYTVTHAQSRLRVPGCCPHERCRLGGSPGNGHGLVAAGRVSQSVERTRKGPEPVISLTAPNTPPISYAWAEDKEHCEEYGRMLNADASKVSARARKRGLPQLGTLGAGNHYAEIQVVEEINDAHAAKKMGIDRVGQICIMIHSGSRGLGHQVATDALVAMEKAMKRDGIQVNDRQVR